MAPDEIADIALIAVSRWQRSKLMKMEHDWIRSTLGHGVLMCKDCQVTILEAQAIGMYKCKYASKEVEELPKFPWRNGDHG